MIPSLYMVFDVESVGLHGEGFAVGYVVIDQDGTELQAWTYACDPVYGVWGSPKNHIWVEENVPKLNWNCRDPRAVREAFWRVWLDWHEKGAMLAADVAWPVEARFLAACVDDYSASEREWEGPYPLIDVASVRFAAGFDPLSLDDRRENELPQHDPLADARQSARLLVEALCVIRANATVLQKTH